MRIFKGFNNSSGSKPFVPPTLNEYVKDTALQAASRIPPGDLAGLSKPEVMVMEIRNAATALAKSSGLAGEAGPAKPLSLEAAMVRVCEDFRGRLGLPIAPLVLYNEIERDAERAGLDVQNPEPPKARGFVARALGLGG